VNISKKPLILSAVIAFALLMIILGVVIHLLKSSDSIMKGNPVMIKAADVISDAIVPADPVVMTPDLARSAIISFYYAALRIGTSDDKMNLHSSAVVDQAKFDDLLNAIHDERDVRNVVALIHDSLNERTGFGNFRSLESPEASTWDYLNIAPFMDERLYEKLAQALPVSSFVKDLQSANELAEIAIRDKNVKAVIYLHRIFHDLDYWAFEEGTQGGWLLGRN
jgi:hypothetical protein